MTPVLRGIRHQYLAGRGAIQVVLRDDDAQTYVAFELSFDSDHRSAMIDRLFVAEAETYWKWRLHKLSDLIVDRPDSLNREPSVGDPISYDEALASLVQPVFVESIYRHQLLHSVAVAVDRGELDMATLRMYLPQLSPSELETLLVNRYRRMPTQVKQRRLKALTEIGSVQRLIPLLKDRKTSDDVVAALHTIVAKKYPDCPIDKLAENYRQWFRWWYQTGRKRVSHL